VRTPVITGHPALVKRHGVFLPTRRRTATFRFRDATAGVTFKCSLDGKAFKACRSGVRYVRLARHRHVFRVFAVKAGMTNSSSASFAWTVRH
jgi:hypothetical protein